MRSKQDAVKRRKQGENKMSNQTILRDSGMKLKTRIKAGLKIKL